MKSPTVTMKLPRTSKILRQNGGKFAVDIRQEDGQEFTVGFDEQNMPKNLRVHRGWANTHYIWRADKPFKDDPSGRHYRRLVQQAVMELWRNGHGPDANAADFNPDLYLRTYRGMSARERLRLAESGWQETIGGPLKITTSANDAYLAASNLQEPSVASFLLPLQVLEIDPSRAAANDFSGELAAAHRASRGACLQTPLPVPANSIADHDGRDFTFILPDDSWKSALKDLVDVMREHVRGGLPEDVHAALVDAKACLAGHSINADPWNPEIVEFPDSAYRERLTTLAEALRATWPEGDDHLPADLEQALNAAFERLTHAEETRYAP